MTDESIDGLTVVADSAVVRVTLDRPKAGNALTPAVMDGLVQAFRDAAASETARVVALSATGKNFCTGVDIVAPNAQSIDGQPRPPKPRIGHLRRNINVGPHSLVATLAEIEIPVVVAVRGWAAGIGNSLALLGDHIVVSETAKFWTPFTQRGFTPDSGSTWLLPRLIGLARAKEMVLLGRPVEAAKAQAWGMVNDVVVDDDLDEAFEAVVAEYAAAATVSVGLARAMMHRHLETDLRQALLDESTIEEISVRSDDFKEGIASLRERRAPDYRGR